MPPTIPAQRDGLSGFVARRLEQVDHRSPRPTVPAQSGHCEDDEQDRH